MAPRVGHVTVVQDIVVKGGHRPAASENRAGMIAYSSSSGAMLAELNEGGRCAEGGDGK